MQTSKSPVNLSSDDIARAKSHGQTSVGSTLVPEGGNARTFAQFLLKMVTNHSVIIIGLFAAICCVAFTAKDRHVQVPGIIAVFLGIVAVCLAGRYNHRVAQEKKRLEESPTCSERLTAENDYAAWKSRARIVPRFWIALLIADLAVCIALHIASRVCSTRPYLPLQPISGRTLTILWWCSICLAIGVAVIICLKNWFDGVVERQKVKAAKEEEIEVDAFCGGRSNDVPSPATVLAV
ncbi:hypothetical protein BDV98DRAFT_595952 [Pterulicium gracile]|uniref:Uncharacterized protein n=1 Tax=Pterulicium gracile TaxID=1884261 RepID=A0A5C3QIM6_9AGAR|nr:hypothetical protein BDV98DRAFT_595952 [Pterula gracilis]